MITFYHREGCPKCAVLKKKLDDKNISYTDCMDMAIMEQKGFKSVPWLEVDNHLLDFKAANTWVNQYGGTQ